MSLDIYILGFTFKPAKKFIITPFFGMQMHGPKETHLRNIYADARLLWASRMRLHWASQP